jgi:hypothetical protein
MSYKRVSFSIIVFFVAVYITLATAYAQVASSTAMQQPEPTPLAYQLPYPGMLPDNPLYFLKALRDKLTVFFLSKPLDKADFNLLQSDKNVEASYLLVTQEAGKTDLALTTFSQGQDYFEEGINQSVDAKKQGYSITEMSKKLAAANQKHIQILHAIEQQIGKNDTQVFQTETQRAKTFTKQIRAL